MIASASKYFHIVEIPSATYQPQIFKMADFDTFNFLSEIKPICCYSLHIVDCYNHLVCYTHKVSDTLLSSLIQLFI